MKFELYYLEPNRFTVNLLAFEGYTDKGPIALPEGTYSIAAVLYSPSRILMIVNHHGTYFIASTVLRRALALDNILIVGSSPKKLLSKILKKADPDFYLITCYSQAWVIGGRVVLTTYDNRTQSRAEAYRLIDFATGSYAIRT